MNFPHRYLHSGTGPAGMLPFIYIILIRSSADISTVNRRRKENEYSLARSFKRAPAILCRRARAFAHRFAQRRVTPSSAPRAGAVAAAKKCAPINVIGALYKSYFNTTGEKCQGFFRSFEHTVKITLSEIGKGYLNCSFFRKTAVVLYVGSCFFLQKVRLLR